MAGVWDKQESIESLQKSVLGLEHTALHCG